jgi:hypothetical protein
MALFSCFLRLRLRLRRAARGARPLMFAVWCLRLRSRRRCTASDGVM